MSNRLLLTVVFLLAITMVVGVEFWRRQNLYWYDVHQDYALNFASERVLRTPVEISETGFVVPALADDWDTAVLGIRLSSKLSGFWFEPSVLIEGNGFFAHQFFERGAKGIRYVSLGGNDLEPGDTITLNGRHLKWDIQTGELLLFRNPILDAKRLLVLAPHPDDAEIAAFGLYSEHQSFIATITAGNYVDGLYAHLYDSGKRQDELRGEMRTWDSITVPLLGGVAPARVVNLGFSTGSLKQLFETDELDRPPNELDARFRHGAVAELLGESSARRNWAGLVADLSTLIKTIEPDIIVAPHPSLDAALDHQLTTIALVEALDQAADRQSMLFLYTNHHILAEYYPFGPADSAVGLPPWFDTGTPFATVYSHPLDKHQQVRKLFALEAMHDLRAAPDRFVGGPTRRFLDRINWAATQVIADPLGTYSYYRRAIRPNELFFVYEPAERDLLRAIIANSWQYQ
jgi:LmbE family N-acetylglucosaminyl deacetylase